MAEEGRRQLCSLQSERYASPEACSAASACTYADAEMQTMQMEGGLPALTYKGHGLARSTSVVETICGHEHLLTLIGMPIAGIAAFAQPAVNRHPSDTRGRAIFQTARRAPANGPWLIRINLILHIRTAALQGFQGLRNEIRGTQHLAIGTQGTCGEVHRH